MQGCKKAATQWRRGQRCAENNMQLGVLCLVALLGVACLQCARGSGSGTLEDPAASCESLLARGMRPSGPYWLQLGGPLSTPMRTLCDFEGEGGGWTLVLFLSSSTDPNSTSTLAAWTAMDASNDTEVTRMYKVGGLWRWRSGLGVG